MAIFVGDQLRGGAVGGRLPENQTLAIEGCCGRRDLAAWRQRIAAKTNRAALADMVLETEFKEPRRDRRHKRVKRNGSGRESCSNLYHAATVSVLDPDSRLEAMCPDSSLPRLLTAAFSNSVASVACDPAAGAAWKALQDHRALIWEQARCDLLWRERICATVGDHSPPSTKRGSFPAKRNTVDHLARSL